MELVTRKHVAILLLAVLCGLKTAKGDCSPLCQHVQSVHANPSMVYECYSNGTTFAPKGSVNISIFSDGTQSRPNEYRATDYFASSSMASTVSRINVDCKYNQRKDIVNCKYGIGKSYTFSFLAAYKSNALYTSEVQNGITVYKIYDIDPSCRTAKEFYEELCQKGCDLFATRYF